MKKKIWADCSPKELEIKLINRKKIDNISMLSDDVFSMAKKVKISGQFLNDEAEYSRLKNLLQTSYEELENELKNDLCEMYSESILDLDFAFGKSTNQSLRLGRERFVTIKSSTGQGIFDSIKIEKLD